MPNYCQLIILWKYVNNSASCCTNSLFMQSAAVCSYFPLDKHEDKCECKNTGEQQSAGSPRSRLVRRSAIRLRPLPVTTASRASLICSAADLRVCSLQRPQRQPLSETRLNFSTLKIFFSSLTPVEPKAQSGRPLFFHYRTFLSGLPPKKDLACQTASVATERSASARL